MSAHLDRRRFLGLAGAGMAALATRSWAERAQRPNVVVIYADDMGYGDLGCFGNPTIRTPQLDAMASRGLRLTSFYAGAPFCTPSRAALLTGRNPIRAGQPFNLGPESTDGLPQSEILIPELLKPRGYRTMCIGKWHLGHRPGYLPTDRGFDRFFGLPYSNDMRPPWVPTDVPLRLYRDAEPVADPGDQETLTEQYTREATGFIRESAGDPFFLYLPHSMPHLPVRTSARFRGDSAAGLYGDVITALDWSVGEVLRTLRVEGLEENTLVIFTSDNGPWLELPDRMLQDGVERWHAGSPGPLRGYKATTYEGGIRVPFVAQWPGRIPAGSLSCEPASVLDFLPTIAHLAGAEPPTDRVLDGHDVMPFLCGETPSPVEEFFYPLGDWIEAVRRGPWKLRYSRRLRTDLGPEDPLTPELFHLDRDPSERYNVAAREPELTAELLNRLREYAAEVGAKVAE